MTHRLGILSAVAAVLLAALVAPAAGGPDMTGRGSFGASAGIMKFYTGDDFKQGELRFIGQALFKYNFSTHWAGEFSSGFGWNAYPLPNNSDEDTLAVVVPTTLGLEYRSYFSESSPLLWHAAAGGGLYFLGVKDTYRTWARATDGQEIKWTSFGLYGKAGAEHVWGSGVSMNLDFLLNYIFSDDGGQIPARWANQNTGFWEIRLGVNYYFRLGGGGDKGEEGDDGEEAKEAN